MIPFKGEIENIKNQIVDKYNPYKIILFGSCARGRAKEDSDIDICIVLDFIDKKDMVIDLTLEIKSEKDIEFIIYTSKQWENNLKDKASFASLIKRTGVEIYG